MLKVYNFEGCVLIWWEFPVCRWLHNIAVACREVPLPNEVYSIVVAIIMTTS